MHGLDGATEISLHDLPRDVRLGQLRVARNLPVACADMRPFRDASGYNIQGVVGTGALLDRTLRIDFDEGKLFFLTSAKGAPGERLDLHYRAGIPEVAANSALGVQMWNIDTGFVGFNSGSVPTVDFLILRRKRPEAALQRSFHVGPSGTVLRRNIFLGEMSLGDVHCGDLVASEHLHSPRNVLGLAFWSRFNVTFDFPRSAIYLQKSHNFERPDRIDLSGARFVRRAGKTVVDVVDDGSASDVAGLRAGDVLLSVRGQDASTMRLFLLRQLCCTPGEKIEMSVMRGDRTFGAEIVLPGARATGKPATGAKTNARGTSGQRSTKP